MWTIWRCRTTNPCCPRRSWPRWTAGWAGLEDHIARREFTREVELDLLIGIIADAVEVDRDDLKRRRAESVRNVKATNGLISLEKRGARRRGTELGW